MKISWVSAPPWASTGYGTQTNEVTKRLVADGHNVAVVATGGFAGGRIKHNGIQVIGSGADARGSNILSLLASNWLGDSGKRLCVTLMDVWAYNNNGWDEMPVLSWVPIEHEGVSDDVMKWFNLGRPKMALAMSRFGENQLIRAGIDRERVFYAPHCVDTSIFRPQGKSMRSEVGIPEDAHLTIINSANMSVFPQRKSWPEMLMAWHEFAKERKDAYLYIHSDMTPAMRGLNLVRLIDNIGIPHNRVRVTPHVEYKMGLSLDLMARVYSMADVLLITSRGEGFGIPAIEAQACGVPIIATDFSAQSELVGSGWKVNGQMDWDETYGGWFMMPLVDSIVESLYASYAAKQNANQYHEMSVKAVEFAANYDAQLTIDKYWRNILEEISKKI